MQTQVLDRHPHHQPLHQQRHTGRRIHLAPITLGPLPRRAVVTPDQRHTVRCDTHHQRLGVTRSLITNVNPLRATRVRYPLPNGLVRRASLPGPRRVVPFRRHEHPHHTLRAFDRLLGVARRRTRFRFGPASRTPHRRRRPARSTAIRVDPHPPRHQSPQPHPLRRPLHSITTRSTTPTSTDASLCALPPPPFPALPAVPLLAQVPKSSQVTSVDPQDANQVVATMPTPPVIPNHLALRIFLRPRRSRFGSALFRNSPRCPAPAARPSTPELRWGARWCAPIAQRRTRRPPPPAMPPSRSCRRAKFECVGAVARQPL